MMVMALPGDPFASDEAQGSAMPTELPFVDVARHLSERGVRVPAVYLDATADGVLLIEDLGDLQLQDMVRGGDETTVLAWYEAAESFLAKIHRVMWPMPTTSIAGRRTFGFELLRWELDHYREWGVEAVFGRLAAPVRDRLDEAFDDFAQEIDALPKGFVHRDYQSRNLMVLSEVPAMESLSVIDFQDAFIGPRIYDLVALLNDSYVSLSWEIKDAVIARYADHLGLDAATLEDEFHLVTVQRKLKDGGRFVFIDRVKNNPGYLGFVEGSFRRAKESLARLSGHEALKRALEAADPKRFGGD